jgi:hypothetical protein
MTEAVMSRISETGAQGTRQQLSPALSLLGMVILLASSGWVSGQQTSWYTHETLNTTSTVEQIAPVGDRELLEAITRLHDRILAAATELSSEARQLLYSNLWQLYD